MPRSDSPQHLRPDRRTATGLALSRVEPVAALKPSRGTLRLPKQVQQLVAHILSEWDGISPIQGGTVLADLCVWLTDHYDELGLGQWDEMTPGAIDPSDVSGEYLSDEGSGGLMDSLGLDESDAPSITDEMRVDHARGLLTDFWHSSYCACGAVPLRSKQHTAVLAYGVRGFSWAGLFISWFGVFPTMSDAWSHLRRAGWKFSKLEVAAMQDSELLALWHFSNATRDRDADRHDAGPFIATQIPW